MDLIGFEPPPYLKGIYTYIMKLLIKQIID